MTVHKWVRARFRVGGAAKTPFFVSYAYTQRIRLPVVYSCPGSLVFVNMADDEDEEEARREERELAEVAAKRERADMLVAVGLHHCECFLPAFAAARIKKVAQVADISDGQMAEWAKEHGEPDIKLLKHWRGEVLATRAKWAVGAVRHRPMGGAAGDQQARGKGSAGTACREDGIGGKEAPDVYKWKEKDTSPAAIVDMLVVSGLIWYLTCESDLVVGPKREWRTSWKWKKLFVGPYFRHWRFPPLQVVGEGTFGRRNGKAGHVWELVQKFKSDHERPADRLPEFPPDWEGPYSAPADLLVRDELPALDMLAEKEKMLVNGTWPVAKRAQGEEVGHSLLARVHELLL
jgi:hypothetical protein